MPLPPPWLMAETTEAVVPPTPTGRYSHLHFENEPGRRMATKQLNKDEPRRIAANIAKIPALILGGATSLLPCR
jgi:hypothetical protein